MCHALRAVLAGALLALCSCGRPAPPPTAPQQQAATPSAADKRLDALVEDYFEEKLRLNPVAATFIGDHRYDDRLSPPTPVYQSAARAMEQGALDRLRQLGDAGLDAEGHVNYEIFEYGRRMELEGLKHPAELLPLDQFNNPAVFFAQLGSGESVQPFATVRDYENFASRMALFAGWADQALADMRAGIAQGIVLPHVLVERVIPQLAAHVVDDPERSVFWQPIAKMPADFPPADRKRLTALYRESIARRVVPAYRRLLDFMRGEYLGKSRSSVGLSALPGGAAWYAYLARAFTTTDTPVEQIHETGLREVARIDGEVAKIMGRIGFSGDVAALADSMRRDPRFACKTGDEILDHYRALEARVEAAIPRLFMLTPKSRLEIRPFEPFREQSQATAEYYAPSADGARPGVFYVNTWDLPARPTYEEETIFLHEAIPGHHFQVALAVENSALPRYRRYSSDDAFSARRPEMTTAYTEGWGLYAESLGDELGMYTDPYAKLGNLFGEGWRAVRLVVDTGIHAKGWTREQALDYMLAHTALSRTDATAEIERYIAWPGQALAYKTGQMTIRGLRSRAEQELGARFDVRAFHAEVLDDGPMPLAVLEAKIARWIEAQKGSAPQ